VSKCLERGGRAYPSHRISMHHPNILWWPVQQTGYQSRDSSPLGPGLCSFVDMNFGEFSFHALR
jgi:hypothetical protein